MAISGINTIDGKQIIAAGAQSAKSAASASYLSFKDTMGTEIETYPGYGTGYGHMTYGHLSVSLFPDEKYTVIDPTSIYFINSTVTAAQITPSKVNTWDSLSSGKQDALNFSYTDGQISLINGSAIYSQGGGAFPYTGNVQQALDKVYTDSATWDDVSAKEDKLTFGYTDGKISMINNSAIYSQGGGGGGSQNVLILTGTQCLTANGGPIYIRKNDNIWKYVEPTASDYTGPITSDDVLQNAMVVVKEISNGYSSFDLSLDLSGVGAKQLENGAGGNNNAPFGISGFTAAIPVSCPVTNYANSWNTLLNLYNIWRPEGLNFYTTNSEIDAHLVRSGYTHWEVHGFVH